MMNEMSKDSSDSENKEGR